MDHKATAKIEELEKHNQQMADRLVKLRQSYNLLDNENEHLRRLILKHTSSAIGE